MWKCSHMVLAILNFVEHKPMWFFTYCNALSDGFISYFLNSIFCSADSCFFIFVNSRSFHDGLADCYFHET